MQLGNVYSVLVRDVTNQRSFHSVTTGTAQFIVDGIIQVFTLFILAVLI
jgi:hypothetical protein